MEHEIHYSGHPFVDIGIGTVLAMCGKRQPAQLTNADLESVAERLLVYYTERPAARNYISIIFPNSWFTQPAGKLQDRQEYGRKVLFEFSVDQPADDTDERCAFFPLLKAVMLAKRQHIPLLTSEETGNFSANGQAGLPVSGLALLCIHAMPLGCLKCSGRYLGFHQISNSEEAFAGRANWLMAKLGWEYNRQYMALDSKVPAYGSHRRTRYVEALLRVRASMEQFDARNISGYYFTNYGTGADVEILKLSNAVVEFIDAAQQDYGQSWQQLTQSQWDEEKIKGEEAPTNPQMAWRNRLFEALFQAEEKPSMFLAMLVKSNRWDLARLFMRKVMNMQDKEIELYERIGHQLAEYMVTYDYNVTRKTLSWGLYHQLKDAKPDQLGRLLRKARERASKAGVADVLIPLDDFVVAFVRTQRNGFNQFYLARDLVAYALFDRLHMLGHTLHDSKAAAAEGDDINNEYVLSIQSSDEE